MYTRRTDAAIVRYLLLQAGFGCVIGLAFAGLMLGADAGGLRTLVVASRETWTIALFVAGSVFALLPLVFATAVGILAFENGEC